MAWGSGDEIQGLREDIMRAIKALKPFAVMDRDDCDLNEVVCLRGHASDTTLITSQDFRCAAKTIAKIEGTA